MIFHAARVAPEKAVFRPALPMCFLLGITEMQMTVKTTYGELLKNPNWQRKRLEMLEAAGWSCKVCAATEKTLHVHHKQYIKGRKPWEYENSELEVLCEDCHSLEHVEKKAFADLLMAEWNDMTGEKIAMGFLAGFLLPMNANLAEKAMQMRHLPFFDVGFAAAALGPRDLLIAVKKKMDEGRFPEGNDLINEILSGLDV